MKLAVATFDRKKARVLVMWRSPYAAVRDRRRNIPLGKPLAPAEVPARRPYRAGKRLEFAGLHRLSPLIRSLSTDSLRGLQRLVPYDPLLVAASARRVIFNSLRPSR